MARLYQEIDARNLYHSENMSEMFNQQYATISRLRDISLKMTTLDNECTNITAFISTMNTADPKLSRSASNAYLSRSYSSRARFGPIDEMDSSTSAVVKSEQPTAWRHFQPTQWHSFWLDIHWRHANVTTTTVSLPCSVALSLHDMSCMYVDSQYQG